MFLNIHKVELCFCGISLISKHLNNSSVKLRRSLDVNKEIHLRLDKLQSFLY